MRDFLSVSARYSERVDALLDGWLSTLNVAPVLQQAMRYSVFNGGKRVRPFLVMATADSVSNSNDLTLTAAAAIECIHAYSLVHDDLPAMDDDDLRRGKPTCHIQFDEATAILAGDALQSLAFEHLGMACSKHGGSPEMIVLLAHASGANGMVGGQVLDLLAEGLGADIELEQLQKVHTYKTGALIKASVLLGAMSVNANDNQLSLLSRYADALGLAFQVQDDIIDVTSDTNTLGKTQGADDIKDKSTFVSLLGLDASRQKARDLIAEAKNALGDFSGGTSALIKLAEFCITRDR